MAVLRPGFSPTPHVAHCHPACGTGAALAPGGGVAAPPWSPGHPVLLGPVGCRGGRRGGGVVLVPSVRGTLPPAEPAAPPRAALLPLAAAAHVREGPVMSGRDPS